MLESRFVVKNKFANFSCLSGMLEPITVRRPSLHRRGSNAKPEKMADFGSSLSGQPDAADVELGSNDSKVMTRTAN
jgi:hypothetical protein